MGRWGRGQRGAQQQDLGTAGRGEEREMDKIHLGKKEQCVLFLAEWEQFVLLSVTHKHRKRARRERDQDAEVCNPGARK